MNTIFARISKAFWLALPCLLTACDSPVNKEVEPPRSSVSFLHYFTDSLSGGVDEMARAFDRQSSLYALKAVSLDHEAFKTSIQDTLKAGNPPDLYSYWAGARTASIIEHLVPVDDIWQQAELDRRFSPALIRAAVEYGGQKYFVPLTQHFIGFFYNKRLFEAHGLQPPTTWEEFLAVCEALKAKGVTPIALGARDKWPAQFWFDYLLLRTAPYEFRQALMAGEASFDDPRVMAVFARWKQLVDKGYFNRDPHPNNLAWDSGANEMLFRGEAAMTLMGTWNIGYFTNDAHAWEAGKDFDFFPFPIIDPQLPKVAMGPIDGLILPKRAANPAGARQVMAFLAGVEAQQALSQGSGALAPNRLVPETAYSDIQRRVRDEIQISPLFTFAFDLAAPPPVAELGLNAFADFLAFPDAHPQIVRQLAVDARRRFAVKRD
jgi:multiple sugar transport system substrate-binding protein/raffinose/stachyose/melibiose transport system substrate-binding protein